MAKVYIDTIHDVRKNAVNVKVSLGTDYFPSASKALDAHTHKQLKDITDSLCLGALEKAKQGLVVNNIWYNRMEELARIVARGNDLSLQCCCSSDLTNKKTNCDCHAEVIRGVILTLQPYLTSVISQEELEELDPIEDIIVAGGRDFNNYDLLADVIEYCVSMGFISDDATLICGEAKGADTQAKMFWEDAGLSIASYPAKWDDISGLNEPVQIGVHPDGKKYNKLAGTNRNGRMSAVGKGLIAFWDGKSSGTRDMIERMLRADLPVYICLYNCGLKQKEIQEAFLKDIDSNPKTEGAYIQFIF